MYTRGFILLRRLSTDSKNTKFFTTPIYYVNAKPHIGHLYSSLIADAAQRWQHVYQKSSFVKFSTGTDEHGSKIQQAAEKNNTTPDKYCDKISSEFQKMVSEFDINCTDFIRTSETRHKDTVAKLWRVLNDSNHIYLSKYEGWYCVSDETFLTESQLKEVTVEDGKKILVSEESGNPVEWSSEENYMFKLSAFQDDLNYWLKNNEDAIRPRKFHKILLDLINKDDGLQDLSVSRPTSRVQWGIPVPADPSQKVYVWLDALANYLTVSKYASDEVTFKKCWPPDVQVIGKDILKFHGIYWPAFLLAAKLELPKMIFCHSHWTVNSEKMSKSKGNVVCPIESAKKYTTDGMRYFLLREGVAHSDGNYSDIKVTRILNSELADTLGNLLSRCTGTALNPKQIFPKLKSDVLDEMKQIDVTKKLIDSVQKLPDTCRDYYIQLNFYKAVDSVIATLHVANLFFETLKPWELKKNPENHAKLDVALHLTLETLRISCILLQPIVPNLANVVLEKLNVPEDNRYFENVKTFSWNIKNSSEKPLKPEKVVLFKRILTEEDTKVKVKKGL
ncbi:methionine--tRNA ligase, mitochondrial [Diorhabda carinulata]|uniref:methionine--tRNA ligase, mitochondrial n=1 Tax=Diorhabda carinulata TaxID=1163345 RepID=UPI0025A09544|nr:methionine--tRNA ligase, mitochondrial [Diorhabda carinulata]